MNTQTELEFPPFVPEPVGCNISNRFNRFHQANPEVYNNLVRLARDFRRRAQNHNRPMGIAMLFEVLRWNYYLSVDLGEEDFKLSNDFRAPYARLIMSQEPDLKDAFKTKTSVVD